MTLRDEVIEVLGVGDGLGYDVLAGFKVSRRTLGVERWAGDRPDSLPDDCRKRRSLLVAADGRMSCIEVEVVRLLRAHWEAGWVQGFACGSRSWADAIWKTLPMPVQALNEQVQQARGLRMSSFSGHPDVAVTDGTRVVYIECKMEDSIKPTQVAWFGEALARKIVSVDQVLIIQGFARG